MVASPGGLPLRSLQQLRRGHPRTRRGGGVLIWTDSPGRFADRLRRAEQCRLLLFEIGRRLRRRIAAGAPSDA